MNRFTITPIIKKQLKQLADKLPVVFINTNERHIMTKEELDGMGYADAEKLPDGNYIYRMPVQLAANHSRRIKKIFRSYGSAGVALYMQLIYKIDREQKNN